MIDRLFGWCFGFLAAAVAVYVAIRLIEAVASGLIIILAVIAGLIIIGGVARLIWARHRANQW